MSETDDGAVSGRNEAFFRFAREVADQEAARKREREERLTVLRDQLARLQAPAVYVLLKGERKRTSGASTQRPSNANITAADVRGQVDGFIAGLALALDSDVGEIITLLDDLSADLDWNTARRVRIDKHLPTPSSIAW